MNISYDDALSLRKEIQQRLKLQFHRSADVVLMTSKEAADTGFPNFETAVSVRTTLEHR